MKVYGSQICGDCRNFKHLAESRNIQYDDIDICENTTNLKEFLHYRDTLEIFKEVKNHGGIGIPLFEIDGKYTLDVNEALALIGQEPIKDEEILEHAPACETCK